MINHKNERTSMLRGKSENGTPPRGQPSSQTGMTKLRIEMPWPDEELWENRKKHWRTVAPHRRAQKQHAAALARSAMVKAGWSVPQRKVITYIFHPPKAVSRYDTTNAAQALKGAQDGMCAALGFDDSEFDDTLLRRGEKGAGMVIMEIGECI